MRFVGSTCCHELFIVLPPCANRRFVARGFHFFFLLYFLEATSTLICAHDTYSHLALTIFLLCNSPLVSGGGAKAALPRFFSILGLVGRRALGWLLFFLVMRILRDIGLYNIWKRNLWLKYCLLIKAGSVNSRILLYLAMASYVNGSFGRTRTERGVRR